MKTQRSTKWLVIPLLSAAGCIIQPQPYAYTYSGEAYAPPPPAVAQPAGVAQPAALPQQAGSQPPPPVQEQPDALARGPVHEAFAQPVAAQEQPGAVVESQPPATIIETPPSDRPAGNNCVWVPGYWSWDTAGNRFIWVSGCWRLPPPRMAWIPGYWSHAPNGWLWVSGFWAPAAAQEIAYLPAPPTVADLQPTGAPPAADDFWVPGCWYWYQGRYVLRAGYWLQQHPGWVWTPSHYIWTPRGHVFTEGHWDYALEQRGVLFAPVCFPERVTAGVTIAFTPAMTINIGLLTDNLFACPREAHYYFGDYYDTAYVQAGIYPWFDCVRIGTWYDPVFVYARWDHGRTDPRWEDHERHEFALRQEDHTRRPPQTYREQQARTVHLPEPERNSHQLTRPLSTAVAAPAAPVKFEHVDAPAHQKVVQQSQESHDFREARSRWETAAPTAPKPVGPAPVSNPPSTTHTPTPVGPASNTHTPPTPVGPESTVPGAPAHGSTMPAAPTHGSTTPVATTPEAPTTTAPSHGTSTHGSTTSGATAPVAAPPVAATHDTTPVTTQPDRVRLPRAPGADASGVTRGNERITPDRPTDETRHERSRDAGQ